MWQALWSSNAMLAKCTGWGTALGRRAGDNGVKRTAGARDERLMLYAGRLNGRFP